MVRIYTKSGDDGTTGTGRGSRVPKDDPRIEACGAVDELNSALGVVLAFGVDPELASALVAIQNTLFDLGADLSFAGNKKQESTAARLQSQHVKMLEAWIDQWESRLPPLTQFILPGGSRSASLLHLARALCRRAERLVVPLHRASDTGPVLLPYLNRLSDLLFVMARYQNLKDRHPETLWNSISSPSS